jgi:hypothetical protein
LATPDDDEACRRFDDDDLDRDVLELALAPRGDVVADWWRGEAGDLRGEWGERGDTGAAVVALVGGTTIADTIGAGALGVAGVAGTAAGATVAADVAVGTVRGAGGAGVGLAACGLGADAGTGGADAGGVDDMMGVPVDDSSSLSLL